MNPRGHFWVRNSIAQRGFENFPHLERRGPASDFQAAKLQVDDTRSVHGPNNGAQSPR
jgi:hypothetical protein